MPPAIPEPLRRVCEAELGDDPAALDLIARGLEHRRGYSRPFAGELIAVAGAAGVVDDRGWARRRLAALLLQHQALLIDPHHPGEFLDLLGRMGLSGEELAAGPRSGGRPPRSPESIARRARRRLGRPRPVLGPFVGERLSARSLRAFLRLAECECKLILARSLFSPEDVARRCRGLMQISGGHPAGRLPDVVAEEAARAIAHLPGPEAGLAGHLADETRVAWVARETPARVNALVEHPLGTVVLVVKPPGSDLEFEIKRCGQRRDRPLGVVFERDGRPVPPAHRLDGGSMERSLLWEAERSARLARVYREIHGVDPPIPRVLAIRHINTIPVGGAEALPIVPYLAGLARDHDGGGTPPGPMLLAVDSFARESGRDIDLPAGDEGLALRFLLHTVPTQALLVGTSSFRLDRIRALLTAEGCRDYLARQPNAPGRLRGRSEDPRRVADAVLEEILGIYRPPRPAPPRFEDYIEAAFSTGRNRPRADRVHVALARQLGTFWGTLLALRAYTNGESFVSRNVGIKCGWSDRGWRVGLRFMDHDDLHLWEEAEASFDPGRFLPGTLWDEIHALHDPRGRGGGPPSVLDQLRAIYRSGAATTRRAEAAARRSLCRSYARVQERLEVDRSLGGLVGEGFAAKSLAWDRAVGAFLRRGGPGASRTAWRPEALEALGRGGFSPQESAKALDAIKRFGAFFDRFRTLWTGLGGGRPGLGPGPKGGAARGGVP